MCCTGGYSSSDRLGQLTRLLWIDITQKLVQGLHNSRSAWFFLLKISPKNAIRMPHNSRSARLVYFIRLLGKHFNQTHAQEAFYIQECLVLFVKDITQNLAQDAA
jgi:hypothetical protein